MMTFLSCIARPLPVAVALLLLIQSPTLRAQWKWLSPLPQGSSLFDTEFIAGNGWMVGSNTTVLRTSDTGKHWDTSVLGHCEHLTSVDFIDSLHGWVAGSHGFVAYTDDGGRSWQQQTTSTTNTLMYIRFGDSLNGWCVGHNSTLLHTTDGGAIWISVPPPENGNITVLAVPSAREVWIGNGTNCLQHSTDGGLHWESVCDSLFHGARDIYFADASHGWLSVAVTDSRAFTYPVVYRTVDGGDSWEMARVDHSHLILSPAKVRFANARHGILIVTDAANYSRCYLSNDGGETWQLTPHTSGLSNNAGLHSGVCRVDSMHCWVTGGGGLMLTTSNGGTTWTPYSTTDRFTAIQDFHFFDERRGVAAGLYSRFFATTDGGMTWARSGDPVAISALDMFFIDTLYGWTVAERSHIYRTEDGGMTWLPVVLPGSEFTLVTVDFTDRMHGWIIARKTGWSHTGTVLHTTDGGENWHVGYEGPIFSDIDFIDSLRGFVLSQSSSEQFHLFLTDDAGETWDSIRLDLPLHLQLNSLCMTDSLHGWIVGDMGYMLQTTDGGWTWSRFDSTLTTDDLSEIFFLDKNHGWIGSSCGRLLGTSDRGRHWRKEQLPTDHSLPKLQFINPYKGWVGGFGILMTTVNDTADVIDTSVTYQGQPLRSLGTCEPPPILASLHVDGNKVSYQLSEAASVAFTLTDVNGAVTFVQPEQSIGVGSHTIPLPSGSIPSGMYLFRLDVDDRCVTGKVYIMK